MTSEERQLAKAVNFGLIYGMGAPRLAAQARSDYQVDLTDAAAIQIRDRYFREFSGLRRWQRKQAREKSTRTLRGRRRTWEDKAPPFTQLINTPIQGSGADGLKLTLTLLWERRDQCPDAFPVLAIHDEIIIEVPADEAEVAREWLIQCMTEGMSPILRTVPVVVEAETKESWG